MEKYKVEFTHVQLATVVSMCILAETLGDEKDDENVKKIREIAYICLKEDKKFAGQDIAKVYATFLKFGSLINKFANDIREEMMEKCNEKKS